MKALLSMRVAQVRIFLADEVPFNIVIFGGGMDAVKTAFKFRHAAPFQPPNAEPSGAMAFIAGEAQSGAATISIEQIIVEPRKITVAVNGSSEDADAVFSRLVEILRTVDPRPVKPELKPLILTQETTTVAKLDAPVTKLLEWAHLGLLSRRISAISDTNGAQAAVVAPLGLRLRVSYSTPPDSLRANGIELVDKEVRIEHRVNTAPEENQFFIVSPNSSSAHMQLIAALEEVLRAP